MEKVSVLKDVPTIATGDTGRPTISESKLAEVIRKSTLHCLAEQGM